MNQGSLWDGMGLKIFFYSYPIPWDEINFHSCPIPSDRHLLQFFFLSTKNHFNPDVLLTDSSTISEKYILL